MHTSTLHTSLMQHYSLDKGVSKNNIPSIGRLFKKVESCEGRIEITLLRTEASDMKFDIKMAKITGQLESILRKIRSVNERQNMLFQKQDLIHSTLSVKLNGIILIHQFRMRHQIWHGLRFQTPHHFHH